MKTIILLVGLITFLSLSSVAQDCNKGIHGNVKDEKGNPLPTVYIYIDQKAKAVTDTKGHFELHDLCEGDHTITLRSMGYVDQSQAIHLKSHHLIDFILKENDIELQEVDVHGDFEDHAMNTQSQSQLLNADLQQKSGQSFGETLESLPGVQTLKTGATVSKPIIHGLYGSRISIVNNDVKLESQRWGQDHAPELDPFSFDHITVVKGASSLQFGAEALSGVIIAAPPPLPVNTKWKGKVNLVGMSNGKMGAWSSVLQKASKKIKELSWRFQGSLKKGGDLHTPDYNLSNTALRESNISLEAGWRAQQSHTEIFYSLFRTEIGILKAAHTGNLTDLKDAIERMVPTATSDFSYMINNPKQKVQHHLFKLKNTLHLSPKNTLQSFYSYQQNVRQEYDIRRGNRSDIPATDMLLKTHTLDLRLQRSNRAWQSGIGTNLNYQRNRNIFGTGVRPIIPYYNSATIGLYVFQQYIQEQYELEAGVRYDFKNLDVATFDRKDNLVRPFYQFHNISFSLGANYYVSPHLSISTNASSAFRPPNISELFSEGLHHGSGVIEEGIVYHDGNLDQLNDFETEKALKWITTFDIDVPKLSIQVTPYVQWIQNYVYLRPYDTRITIRGFFPVFQYRQTDARLMGGDFISRYQLHKSISLIAQASYVYGQNIREDEILINMPPFSTSVSAKYHLPKWKILENIFFLVKGAYYAQQGRAPQAIDLSALNALSLEALKERQNGPIYDYMAAPKAYTLIGIQLGGDLPLSETQRLSVSLSVDNLLNQRYRSYLNRLRFFADDIGRNYTLRLLYSF